MRKDDTDNATHRALEWASFMMGLPTGMTIDRNDSAVWSTRFRSFYFHDDWRLSPSMTLNLGLRYEREAGITERFNRGIAGEFDPGIILPISAGAEAAYPATYAANPNLGLLPPAQFKVIGGTRYLGEADKTFTDGTHQLLPRAGVVYRLLDKTVLRAGYGWYFDTLNSNNTRPRQDGFSQSTSTTISNDRGLNFCCGVGSAFNLSSILNPLIDPFPVRADGTRFDEPYGNTLGPIIRVGRGYDNAFGRAFRPALQQRWRLGIQHELGFDNALLRNTVVEVSYNGARARGPIGNRFRIDALPEQYWAAGNSRQQAVDDDLNKSVANPFNIKNFADLATSDPILYKFMSTQSFFTSSTIRKHQLLRPFPHMNNLQNYGVPGLDFDDIQGINQYNDFTLQFERRMTAGLGTAWAWTHTFNSKEKDWRRNEFDRELSWRPTDQVRPNRFFWQAIAQMPFGREKTWATEGVAEKLLGGWEVSWIWQWQDGTPLGFGNRFFYGDMAQLKNLSKHKETWSGDVHRWFSSDISWNPKANPAQAALCPAGTTNCDPPSNFIGFEGRADKQPGTYHLRMTPDRFADLRGPRIDNWDIKVTRRFRVREQLTTIFSVDLLNAFNHTNFSNPTTDPTSGSFGQIGAQRGLSRVIQFNLRILF